MSIILEFETPTDLMQSIYLGIISHEGIYTIQETYPQENDVVSSRDREIFTDNQAKGIKI